MLRSYPKAQITQVAGLPKRPDPPLQNEGPDLTQRAALVLSASCPIHASIRYELYRERLSECWPQLSEFIAGLEKPTPAFAD
jgi:hypothetical protein